MNEDAKNLPPSVATDREELEEAYRYVLRRIILELRNHRVIVRKDPRPPGAEERLTRIQDRVKGWTKIGSFLADAVDRTESLDDKIDAIKHRYGAEEDGAEEDGD